MNTKLMIAGLVAAGQILAAGQIAAQDVASEETARNAKRLFTPCRACHSLEKDGPQSNGPSLYALLGRRAGSNQGFDYSEAMKKSSIVWSEQGLDTFLKDPQAAVPGNKMAYAGMSEAAPRKILIEYLKEHTGTP